MGFPDQYVAVDLEMTGLSARTERILEIGAVKIIDGQLGECFQTLVNPHRELTEQIMALTGITEAMAAEAPGEQEALAAFLQFAGELPLIGHNIRIDFQFLKQSAVNQKLTFERKGIDTLKIARKLLVKPEKKSLESLCRYFGIAQSNAHRALDDAKASGELFLLLREIYQEKEPGLFVPKPLQCKVKKQGPITPKQKRDLNHLLIYHKIRPTVEIETLSKNEASRMIDRIYARYGRVPKQEESNDV